MSPQMRSTGVFARFFKFCLLCKGDIEMKNNNRLYFARQKFLGKCPVCGKTLKKADGVNILRCDNAVCSGVTVRRNGESSQEPYYRMLNDKNMEIYEHLFNKK